MLTQLIVWLNAIATLVGRVVLAPIAWLPGWLSATGIAVITGVVMLLVFKHTSDQSGIRRVRSQIKANLLSLSLFKDSLATCVRAQARILVGAARLLRLAFVPMLVMLVPMALLLAQLALWYQARPLAVGSNTVVTARFLAKDIDATAEATLESSPAFDLEAGPVRIKGKEMVCWRIVAREPGLHDLTITVGEQRFTKEIAVGDGFLPVSIVRPRWNWLDALVNPRETPFDPGSDVQSIELDYPQRLSWTSGTDWWLWYWLGASLAAAFAARPLLKVNI
jgi:hypothetical protein